MQTILTDSTEEAARILNSGCVVAFPTETVYGLGACICHPEAIGKIFQAKGRPGDNPLIVHIYNIKQLDDVASEINESAEKLIERFFPGPLTLVLKKNKSVPDIVTAGLDTVGVRCPANPVAREFLRLACGPVAAPSANLSGLPSSTSWHAVFKDLDGRISCILKGEESTIGLESTIVDCSGASPVLLRAGAITFEALQEVVPGITLNAGTGKESRPKSPGLKYLHYAPKASIVLCTPHEPITAEPDSAYIGLSRPPEGVRVARHCISPEEYGRELFSFFRLCDAEGIRVIYCELPSSTGIGRAIRDRLTRAAGKE
ncbi:L-threonylcarbamoyladenylate synthase [Chlorobium ferrooxidans]|uniref:Threonylcarbamoyl-AMP synthase n=1 Tax=Chlorobium ferrooxidans DSM 13031 TaxID=377431 RepID=Q0YTP5_9CHLB|nr:L-threonylcarbamoyladenylate synthase [Chlorobium ferrooxidans]EAT59855.1 Sua5/YciO/YrdC/YwlC [Chlorobium ferrooxidans DSM 13031]